MDVRAFVKLFSNGRNGKDFPRLKNVSDTKYIHHLMNNINRQFCMDPSFLFHLVHQQDMKTINGSISYIMRKMKNYDEKTLVNAILKKDPQLEDNITSLFPQLRSHESYWKQRKMELLTLIK